VLPERSLISVVDDDQAFRDSMRRLLRSLGYAAMVFPSAPEFLISPELTTTACLVADVQMPKMTGIELYAHLVAIGRTIPTILVTAYPDDKVYKRARDLGIECYLSKPLEGAELISCLRCAFARRNSVGGAP
jgi:FixJ family two-component response regulator